MQRWNGERALMKRRWERETEHHRSNDWYYDLCGLEHDHCTCLRGYGYFRKIRREGTERGSAWVQYAKRADRRAERQGAVDMIREQKIEGMALYTVGRRRVPFRLDWLS